MSMEELRLAELMPDKVANIVVDVGGEAEIRTHSFVVITPGEKPECTMYLEQPDGSLHSEERVCLEGSIPTKEIDKDKTAGILKTGEFAVIHGLSDRYGRALIHHPITEIRLS